MTDQATYWRRLRLKVDPTAADTDWRGTQTTPNTLTAVVGGTASNGVYSITFTGKVYNHRGVQGRQYDINVTVSRTRTSETSAQMAGLLEDDMDASAALLEAGITADVSSATITITFPPGAYITMTASAPGSATITFPLGALMPILASAPHFARAGNDSQTGVEVIVSAMAGATLLAPGTSTQTTFDLQGIELAIIETVDARGDRTYTQRVIGTTVLTGCTLDTPYELPLRGAKYWTARIASIPSNPVATTDSYEIAWRDSAT